MSRSAGQGFLPAAEEVLKKAQKPMRCGDIVAKATEQGLLESRGKTPEKTLHALFRRSIEREGTACRFYSPKPGYFALR